MLHKFLQDSLYIQSTLCNKLALQLLPSIIRLTIDCIAFYSGKEVEAKQIRAHIGKTLPKYMLPHVFVYLENMPLSSSGKIDRTALPDVDLDNIINDQEYVAPRTNLQIELCRLLDELLEI